jgi:hypothetical protein
MLVITLRTYRNRRNIRIRHLTKDRHQIGTFAKAWLSDSVNYDAKPLLKMDVAQLVARYVDGNVPSTRRANPQTTCSGGMQW